MLYYCRIDEMSIKFNQFIPQLSGLYTGKIMVQSHPYNTPSPSIYQCNYTELQYTNNNRTTDIVCNNQLLHSSCIDVTGTTTIISNENIQYCTITGELIVNTLSITLNIIYQKHVIYQFTGVLSVINHNMVTVHCIDSNNQSELQLQHIMNTDSPRSVHHLGLTNIKPLNTLNELTQQSSDTVYSPDTASIQSTQSTNTITSNDKIKILSPIQYIDSPNTNISKYSPYDPYHTLTALQSPVSSARPLPHTQYTPYAAPDTPLVPSTSASAVMTPPSMPVPVPVPVQHDGSLIQQQTKIAESSIDSSKSSLTALQSLKQRNTPDVLQQPSQQIQSGDSIATTSDQPTRPRMSLHRIAMHTIPLNCIDFSVLKNSDYRMPVRPDQLSYTYYSPRQLKLQNS